ncbi:endolytic transglycosylase MltG [Pasteurella skyensis]|uniref:Endolytic murein transglycosylase n=1 Tax=Phocoenobacter skyensis TaxID=97481 RepID=A0AAJ6NZZ2_9PAST|nr:endolytic transglycosylase MltG [Pasteurella skyensis]MDP8161971.1 endolytic transglycosylase MltG [Pasteurella skyensis]MDP8172127.1 endolytic transglycosylase MltG [Pasteurella skyensis]MDP8176525.1 endolytic transglycosylase MltG [Pasteurella skyensis]MDP8178413.1 endolytic transglycosylase MltG [Pasteurella skyensis]MDP8182831.1 endolytic transglycosylase MltG [Pasteurella skyensis]
MFKKLCFILLLVILTLCAGTYHYFQVIGAPINKTEPLFVVKKGMTSKQLSSVLIQDRVVESSPLLPYIIRFNPKFKYFKAGVYSLKNINTLTDLLVHLNNGAEIQLSLSLIEGKSFQVWRQKIEQAPYLSHTLKDKSEAEIAKLLGIPHQKLEGWFAPNTYHYAPHSTDLALLKRIYQQQQQILEQAWQSRDKKLPLRSPYEMLILASIVEKETGKAAERPQVASVFINRLRLKMKLQTDPTVIYGMGDKYQGNIRKKDLRQATAYNTYVIDGLPPTPIAMPSESAINAVAHPDNTPYLYFVADGSGGHKFSRTLKEHNRAVRKYVKWLRSQKGK